MTSSLDSKPGHTRIRKTNIYVESSKMTGRERPQYMDQYEHDSNYGRMDQYAESHLHQPAKNKVHEALEWAQVNAGSQGLPPISVYPQLGKFLALQARLLNAKNILEVGTLGGYSTIWMASAGPDIKIVSVEVSSHHKKVAEENVTHAGLQDQIEIRLGPGLEVLPKLVEEFESSSRPAFDMVFIDADKANNLNYVQLAMQMTRRGSLIIIDNIVRQGRTGDPSLAETDIGVSGARKAIEGVGLDDRLEATVMQTVSGYNHDGFLFAVVK